MTFRERARSGDPIFRTRSAMPTWSHHAFGIFGPCTSPFDPPYPAITSDNLEYASAFVPAFASAASITSNKW